MIFSTTSNLKTDRIASDQGVVTAEALEQDGNGFCERFLLALPKEFVMQAQGVLAISVEGSVE